jgi:hypothetical protein
MNERQNMRNFLLFAILVIGFILSIEARAQFYWGNVNTKDAAVNLTNQIAHQNDSKTIEVGTSDPTSAPVNAATGSLYLNNTALFQKLDNGSSTNWIPFLNGPAGSGTDECLSRWDGTGVPLLQDSAVCVSDSGDVTGATSLIVDNFLLNGNTIAATGDMIVSATGEVRLDTVSTSSAPYIDASGYLNSYQLTDGQLLIGSSGSIPVAAQLTGTANQININSASGSITLSTPQNLDTGASVEFGNLQVGAVAASSAVITDASGFFQNSVTTSTEIGYLSGVTSSVQNQLDGKLTENLTNTYIFIGDASGFAQENPVSGDLSLTNTGDAQIVAGSIVNADVNATAAIDTTKLEALTANTVGVLDASGFLSSDSDWTYNATTNVSSLTGQSNVDNTRLDGNTLSSTNSNGSLLLAPNGTGSVGLDFTGSQDYYFGWNANDSDSLIIQGQSSATNSTVDLFSTDGDNVNTSFRVIGSGLPSSMATNFEAVQFGWLDSAQKYRIFSGASGTGTARDFSIDVGTNLNALHVDSATGWVSVNGSSPSSELDVNGRFQVDSTTKPSRPMPSMTDTQRDASTASSGDFVANTDTNRPNFHNGTKWQEVALEDKTLDYFYADNFEVEFIDNYTSGSSAAFDGGGAINGSINLETASPIARENSINYTMNAASGSASDWFASPSIALDSKQKGNYVGLTGSYTYNGSDDDISLILWDDTNDTILDELEIDTATNSQSFQLTAYVPSSSSALKWGAYVNTHNSSKELIVDDIQIFTNPFQYIPYGEISDNCTSFTPAITWTSNSTTTGCFIQQDGKIKMRFRTLMSAAPSPTGTFRIDLPTGYTIDTSAWVQPSTPFQTIDGEGVLYDASSANKYMLKGEYSDSNTITIRRVADLGGATFVGYGDLTHLSPVTIAAGDTIEGEFTIPVTNLNSKAILTPMNNVPSIRYRTNAAQTIPHNTHTVINFEDVSYDQNGYVTTGASWKYTVPVTGKYRVTAGAALSSTAVQINAILRMNINGTNDTFLDYKSTKDLSTTSNETYLSGSTEQQLTKGQEITITIYQNSGGDLNLVSDPEANYVMITRIDKDAIGAFPKDPTCPLTVTASTCSGWSTVVARTYGRPFQDRDGNWFIDMHINGSHDSLTDCIVNVEGISIPFSASCSAHGFGVNNWTNGFPQGGSGGTIRATHGSAQLGTVWSCNNIKLDSKPTISGCDF